MKEDGVLLTAIGNPNVDVIVIVEDTHFFTQYNIPLDGQTPVSDEIIATLEQDFKKRNYKTIYLPGGCSQNTVRVFQWLMDTKYQSCMIGVVGKDEAMKTLRKQLEIDGVKACYSEIEDRQTFQTIILVYKHSRSAVYPDDKTKSALTYSESHLLNHSEALPSIQNSKIVLTEGFFTEHSAEAALRVFDLCSVNGTITAFNISGKHVVEQFFEFAVERFVKKCNVLIGNLEEFNALCTKLNVPSENTKEAAAQVHKIMMATSVNKEEYRIKSMRMHKKILIITNGDQDLLCVTDSDGLISYSVPRMDCTQIKDTTGAGDSFTAGFLCGLVKEQSIPKCLEIGCLVAREMIQQYGTTLPETKIDPSTLSETS